MSSLSTDTSSPETLFLSFSPDKSKRKSENPWQLNLQYPFRIVIHTGLTDIGIKEMLTYFKASGGCCLFHILTDVSVWKRCFLSEQEKKTGTTQRECMSSLLLLRGRMHKPQAFVCYKTKISWLKAAADYDSLLFLQPVKEVRLWKLSKNTNSAIWTCINRKHN